jgi:hypothetical protein
MARKSRRNKSARKPPKTITGPTAKQILAKAKLGRVEQDILYRDLIRKHGDNVPVYVLFEHRAIRLQGAISG